MFTRERNFGASNNDIVVVLGSLVLLHRLYVHGMAGSVLEDLPSPYLCRDPLLTVSQLMERGF